MCWRARHTIGAAFVIVALISSLLSSKSVAEGRDGQVLLEIPLRIEFENSMYRVDWVYNSVHPLLLYYRLMTGRRMKQK
jgi:hypothetical protein